MRAVAMLLDETDRFTSAQEHARLRAAGERIDLGTVYSQLSALPERARSTACGAAPG